MDEQIKQQIRFVLDTENRRLNRQLIDRHEQILAKLDRNEALSQEDLVLVREANEIHVNDSLDLGSHHQEALALEEWLDQRAALSQEEAMEILEQWLDKSLDTPARVYRALHALWEEATPDGAVSEAAFDGEGRCLKCGSRVSLADVTDTVVFVGDEMVKRYDGDITNRNCVRCAYPQQYVDYEDCDEGKEAAAQGVIRSGGEANAAREVAERGG
jgi:hypothetical protein